MSKSKNSYSVKQLNKDLDKLKRSTPAVVERAIQKVIAGTASEDAFTMAFDQVETIPFGVGNRGTLVVTASTDDPVELESQIDLVALKAIDALEQEIRNGMKGVIR